MWCIQAQILIDQEGWLGSRQIPTFYLNENIQGILNEAGAINVATQILNPFGLLTVRVTAERVETGNQEHNVNNPAWRAGWWAAIKSIAER